MTRFAVFTDQLVTAGGLLGANDAELLQGQAGLANAQDACAGTPAAWAFIELCTNASSAVTTGHDAVTAVSAALREAAYAYAEADGTATESLRVRGG